MEKKIKKLINEIIVGKEKSLSKLKKLYQGFFKGKTQKEFDKMNQKFLKSLRDSYDTITKKKKLTEIDKSYLDYLFNKPLSKYISLEIENEIDEAKLKRFARIVYDENSFSYEQRNGFMSLIGWILVYQNWFEDIKLDSIDKDLSFEMNLYNYEDEEKPKINIFASGDKKYKNFLEKIQEVLER